MPSQSFESFKGRQFVAETFVYFQIFSHYFVMKETLFTALKPRHSMSINNSKHLTTVHGIIEVCWVYGFTKHVDEEVINNSWEWCYEYTISCGLNKPYRTTINKPHINIYKHMLCAIFHTYINYVSVRFPRIVHLWYIGYWNNK